MRTLTKLSSVAICLLTIICVVDAAVTDSTSQNIKTTSVLPDSVKIIVERTCYKCHSNSASGLSTSLMNFEKLSNLKPGKQIKKLNAICKEISKDEMPPSGYLSKNPDAKLSEKEKNTICNWTKTEVEKLQQVK